MNDGIDTYIEFVLQKARLQGKTFVIDSGEGNDFEDEKTKMYVEDLSGWLIDEEYKEGLLEAIENDQYELYSKYYVFAKWYKTDKGDIEIKFQECENYFYS
ncbi:MAG: hypothetical protein H7Y18_01105 [Clostridiaceae bacterium]|nr:hypothetical protein [Clostridiaceae bacterium]